MGIFRDNRTLLDAFRRGDAAALEEVYWRYVDTVEGVVRHGARFGDKALYGAPHSTLQDLVQETFVRAFNERTRLAYDGLRDYEPYLLTICRHTLADWWRKQGREVPSETIEEAPPEHVADAPDSADPQLLALTEQYLKDLGPPLSDIHQHRYVADASQEETARALGMTRQNVRTLEDKLRQGLRKFLRKNANQKLKTPAGTV